MSKTQKITMLNKILFGFFILMTFVSKYLVTSFFASVCFVVLFSIGLKFGFWQNTNLIRVVFHYLVIGVSLCNAVFLSLLFAPIYKQRFFQNKQ